MVTAILVIAMFAVMVNANWVAGMSTNMTGNDFWTDNSNNSYYFWFNYSNETVSFAAATSCVVNCSFYIDDVLNVTIVNATNTTPGGNSSLLPKKYHSVRALFRFVGEDGTHTWSVNCTNGSAVQTANDTLVEQRFHFDNDTPWFNDTYSDFTWYGENQTNLTTSGAFLVFRIQINDTGFPNAGSINYTWVSLNTAGTADTNFNFTSNVSTNGSKTGSAYKWTFSVQAPLDFDNSVSNHTSIGAHNVSICVRDKLLHVNCSKRYNYTVTWVNASEIEELFFEDDNSRTIDLNITNTTAGAYTNAGAQLGNIAIDFNDTRTNYTFRMNISAETITYIEGITNLSIVELGNLANISDVNDTVWGDIITEVDAKVTGLSNISFQWVNTSALVNSSNYLFGKTIFNKTFDESFYCNNTLTIPICTRLEWCNHTNSGDSIWKINKTNFRTILPSSVEYGTACKTTETFSGTNRTVIYSRTLSGGAVADDTTAPSITHACDTYATFKSGSIECTCSATDNVDGTVNAPNITYTTYPDTSIVGSFTTTCTANDDVGNTATDTKTYEVRSTGGGRGGTGTGIPATTTTAIATETIATIPAEATETASFDAAEISVIGISITPTKAVSGVKVTVQSLSEKPATTTIPLDSVYQYLKIEATNLGNNLKTGEITFKVPKTWITSRNIDKNTVTLHRFADGIWTELTTTLLAEGTTDITYKATTPGFSYFVITGKEMAAPWEEPAEEAEEAPTAPSVPNYIYYIIIVVIIAVVGWYFYKKKK